MVPHNSPRVESKTAWRVDVDRNRTWLLHPLRSVQFSSVTQLCPTLCDPMDYTVHGILQARILKWVVIPFSKGTFPTLGLNPGLPQCRQILYQLSHKGSLRMLEWVAYPFSSGSSQPRIQPGVSCIAGRFLPTELSGRLPLNSSICS